MKDFSLVMLYYIMTPLVELGYKMAPNVALDPKMTIHGKFLYTFFFSYPVRCHYDDESYNGFIMIRQINHKIRLLTTPICINFFWQFFYFEFCVHIHFVLQRKSPERQSVLIYLISDKENAILVFEEIENEMVREMITANDVEFFDE